MVEERAFWVAWSQIPSVGPTLQFRIKQYFGNLGDAWEASPEELAAVEGVGRQTAESVVERRSLLIPMDLLHRHELQNPTFWTPADPEYPRLLLEIPDPPPVLYYRGEVDLRENWGETRAIAIVGTRYPSDYGKRWTRKISQCLIQAGFTIVSGLARGVDTEAHQTCLDMGGRTLAVLGTGVDVIYPWFNRKLADRLVSQGLLLSEYPAGTQPDKVNFPRRNRIIAGLSRATLVLEAPEKSGALITARLANEYSRDVYALPGSLDNPRSKGCLALLNQGASVILGEDELLDALGAIPSLETSPASNTQLPLFNLKSVSLDPELEQVFKMVPSEPSTVDWIVQQTGLTPGSTLSALAQLELMGLVAQLPGMRYQRC